jgi:hypothetical protein
VNFLVSLLTTLIGGVLRRGWSVLLQRIDVYRRRLAEARAAAAEAHAEALRLSLRMEERISQAGEAAVAAPAPDPLGQAADLAAYKPDYGDAKT